jgi:hypothetical protein
MVSNLNLTSLLWLLYWVRILLRLKLLLITAIVITIIIVVVVITWREVSGLILLFKWDALPLVNLISRIILDKLLHTHIAKLMILILLLSFIAIGQSRLVVLRIDIPTRSDTLLIRLLIKKPWCRRVIAQLMLLPYQTLVHLAVLGSWW